MVIAPLTTSRHLQWTMVEKHGGTLMNTEQKTAFSHIFPPGFFLVINNQTHFPKTISYDECLTFISRISVSLPCPNLEGHSGWMPRANAGHFSKASMSLACQTGDTPARDHAREALSSGCLMDHHEDAKGMDRNHGLLYNL